MALVLAAFWAAIRVKRVGKDKVSLEDQEKKVRLKF